MKKSMLISFAMLILSNLAWAYDPIYTESSPENMGTVPAIHDDSGIPSTMTRWKSARVQATRSGAATHFIIRVGSNNVGSVPIGFAVYSGTSGERDPIGPLLIRGYYASYNFTTAGYYALPFTSEESIPIVSGNYYHLVYLLTPGDEAAQSGWRIDAPSPPPKWFSNCTKDDCRADEPPGVGGEYWNDQYWPTSAGWAMGLLDTISGIQSPIAGFSASPTTGTAPLPVSFTDTSSGAITDWSWSFGDGGNSTAQNPANTYDNPGTYTVSLEVAGPGGTDTRTQTDYITVTDTSQPPVASFSAAPTTGTAPLLVSFTDTSNGAITNWSWSFGDGGTSAEQNPAYTYDNPGTFTVSLEVTGPWGNNTRTQTDYIMVTDTSIQYTLTVVTSGDGNVTLDPAGGVYDANTPVQLLAVADDGWAFQSWSGELVAYENPVTLLMTADTVITVAFYEDLDEDGISDLEEDAGPNNGDANADGQQDSDQSNVATFHIQNGQDFITLESDAGTTLAECRLAAPSDAPGAPSGVTFPYGFFDFTIMGVGAGGTTSLTLYLPDVGTTPNTYWKYGPTPADINPHWYEFMYDSQTGAEIHDNVMTIHFTDALRGDDVLAQDSMVMDIGAPGTVAAPADNDGSGGGSDCFVNTLTGNNH
jgi:PKD repeat protein